MGGATAANQYEGAWNVDGKGASVSDHCTNGSHTTPKRITREFEEGTLYPSHECNGWASRRCIDYYMNYCKAIFERYKDKVRYWLTFNEINCMAMPLGAVLSLGTIKGYEGPVTNVPDNKQERWRSDMAWCMWTNTTMGPEICPERRRTRSSGIRR